MEIQFSEITECGQVSVTEINRLLCQLSPHATPISEKQMKEIISAPNSHMFVLLEREKVIGMVTIGTYQTPTGRKAWIEDVVVDEIYRGHGYGRLLIERAIHFINQSRETTLMLTSRPEREAANKLYQSIGFTRKQTNVYKMEFGKRKISQRS